MSDKSKQRHGNYRKNDKDKMAMYNRVKLLKNSYGITPDIYDSYLDAQHGRCAICGKHQSELKRRLFVDHDHITKKVRGLLCYRCNTGLGTFNDSIALLDTAISYLKERSE